MTLPSQFALQVAENASMPEHRSRRDLLFFLHYVACQMGGLEKFAVDLIECMPHRLLPSIRKSHLAPEIIDRKCATNIAICSGLAQTLRCLCTDPEEFIGFRVFAQNLWEVIAEYRQGYINNCLQLFQQTSVSAAIFQTLDRALRGVPVFAPIICIQGEVGVGKSTATHKWAEAQAGAVRYVNLRCTGSKSKFFENLAMALGLHVSGNASYSGRLQSQVEQFLISFKGLVIFDNAHLLFLTKTHKIHTHPVLIQWMLSMQDHGVGFALIASQQFTERLKAAGAEGSWEGAQFVERIGRFVRLESLSLSDFEAVTRHQLPNAGKASIAWVAAYAHGEKTLHAVVNVKQHATTIGQENGRAEPAREDFEKAVAELSANSVAELRKVFTPQKTERTTTAEKIPVATAKETRIGAAWPYRGASLQPAVTPESARRLTQEEIVE